MRRLHYSIHTERTYCARVKQFVRFHKLQSREALLAIGSVEIEAFSTSLAVERNVAASTQNQALNALVFLYKKVLEQPLEGRIDAARSTKEPRVPEVLTREEVAKLLPLIDGTAGMVVRLLYGSGLRITEAVRLRVQDVDFGYKQITVRSGKGNKDRVTTFPEKLAVSLQMISSMPQLPPTSARRSHRSGHGWVRAQACTSLPSIDDRSNRRLMRYWASAK